jgi:hypothetical protein
MLISSVAARLRKLPIMDILQAIAAAIMIYEWLRSLLGW